MKIYFVLTLVCTILFCTLLSCYVICFTDYINYDGLYKTSNCVCLLQTYNFSDKINIGHCVELGYYYLIIIIYLLQAVEKLVQGAESGCPTEREKQVVLNCTRILTRILPYIFEDQDWRGFFWSTVPGAGRAGVSMNTPLKHFCTHLSS